MRAPGKRTLHRQLARRYHRGDSGGRGRVVHPPGGPLCPVAGSGRAAGPHLPAAALHRQPRGEHHPDPGPDRGGRRSLPAGSLPTGIPALPAVSPGRLLQSLRDGQSRVITPGDFDARYQLGDGTCYVLLQCRMGWWEAVTYDSHGLRFRAVSLCGGADATASLHESIWELAQPVESNP